jgi:YHS domain-containing protein
MPAKETTMKDTQMQTAKTAEDAKKTTTAAAASVEQTTCPVMDGNKIDKNVFVEYKGKKVYFCCADCKAKFLAEPEKYAAKLPQFAK